MIEERLATKVHHEGTVWVTTEDFVKGDLIGNPRTIKATLPIGEGDCAAASEPSRDGGNLGRVRDKACSGEDHIVVNIITLQGCERTRASRDAGEGCAFVWNCDGRLFRHMNAVFRAALPIPLEPVVQVSSPHMDKEKRHPSAALK